MDHLQPHPLNFEYSLTGITKMSMTRFEQWISGVERDHYFHCATTTADKVCNMVHGY